MYPLPMRIIKTTSLQRFWERHPDAMKPLKEWIRIVEDAAWESIQQVRLQYPHADAVQTQNGNVVTVLNVKGGRYRLIVAIHYNTQTVYIREFLTHAEYDKNDWKARH